MRLTKTWFLTFALILLFVFPLAACRRGSASGGGNELDGTWVSAKSVYSPSKGTHSFYFTFSGEEYQYGEISGGNKHSKFAGTFTIEENEIWLSVNGEIVDGGSFSRTGNTVTINGSDFIKE